MVGRMKKCTEGKQNQRIAKQKNPARTQQRTLTVITKELTKRKWQLPNQIIQE
jgi:hypothetical protein